MIIIVLSYLLMILSLGYTYLVKYIIDNISSLDKVIMVLFIFISLFKIIISFIISKASNKIIKKINVDLTNNIIKSLINLPYPYYCNYTTGEILSRYDDVEKIKSVISSTLNIIISLPIILFMLYLLIFINYKLGLILIFIIAIYLMFYYLFNKKLITLLIKYRSEKANYNSQLVESLKNYETIKAINITKAIIDRLVLSNNNIEDRLYKIKNINSTKNIIAMLLTTLSPFIIIKYYNYITPGSIFLVYYIFNALIEPMTEVVDFIIDYKESSYISRKIDEFKIVNNEGNKIPCNYNIKFKNLNYKFGINYILKNVNLDIKYGSKVFIMGESGSGKSTLVKLIKGLYKTSHLYIGDTKINKCSKDKIMYAGQDDHLFTDTLYNNFFTDKDIKKYIDMCMVNKDLSFLIEEDGFNISRGERARISLARACAKEAEILIFDEVLEHVDVNMERIILKRIFDEFKNKTIIVISHRLDNLDLFDTLLKVENGYVNYTKYLN